MPANAEDATKKLQCRASADLAGRVEGYARYHGIAMSEAVRRLLELGLEYEAVDVLATPIGQVVSVAISQFTSAVGDIVQDRMDDAALDMLQAGAASTDASMAALAILNRAQGGEDGDYSRLLLEGAYMRQGMSPSDAEARAAAAMAGAGA